MTNIKIFLKSDGEWTDYTHLFCKKDDSLLTDSKRLTYDKPAISSLSATAYGTAAEMQNLKSMKYARLEKDGLIAFEGVVVGDSQIVFLSTAADRAELSMQFDDYSSLLPDVEFPEDVEYWQDDSIKVCDPSDASRSLLHILYSHLLSENPYGFTLSCEYSDTSIVGHFSASAGTPVHERLSEFLEQNGLAYYMEGKSIRIVDIVGITDESSTATGTTVLSAHTNVKLKGRFQPEIEIAPVSYPEYHQANNGNPVVIAEAYGTGEWLGGGTKVCFDSELKYDYKLDKEDLIDKEFKGPFSFENNYSDCITVDSFQPGAESAKLRLSKHNYFKSLFDWGTVLKFHSDAVLGQIKGRCQFAVYSTVVSSDLTSGEAKRCGCIWDEAHARRYIRAQKISSDMKSATYEFKADSFLQIGSFAEIPGIEAGVLLIVGRTDFLNGTYLYEAVRYSGAISVTFEKETLSFDISPVSREKGEVQISASQQSIVRDQPGSIRIWIRKSGLADTNVPYAWVNGQPYLTSIYDLSVQAESEEAADAAIESAIEANGRDASRQGEFYADIPCSAFSSLPSPATIKATCSGLSASMQLGIVENGTNGYSSAQIALYKRAASAPSAYDGGVLTFVFSTHALTGDFGSWSRTIPSGNDPLYVIYASAFANAETDTIAVNEWTAPEILSENGTAGEKGLTVATVPLYQRSATAPSKPSAAITYYFEAGTISGLTQGWSKSIPSGTLPIWIITATAVSRNDNDAIEPSEWTEPAVLAQNGEPGPKGDPGNGISSVTVTYGVSSSPSETPTSWGTAMPSVPEGQYLWTRTITDYTDPSVEDTVAYTYAKQGEAGSPGAPGASGTSVTVSSIQYQTGTSPSTPPTGTWGSNPVDTTASMPYLWTKTTFSDGSIAYGVAKRGDAGISLTGIIEEYALSTSSTSVTGSWGTGIPTLTATNRYLWNRSKNTYSDGTSSAYTSPVVIGVYGDQGAAGRGISSITEYYLASNSTTAPADGASGWSTAIQTPTEANPYLWNKTVVAYTSGSPTVTKALIGRSIKGNPADWLELDVSNTALKNGQESVISASGSGDITTTITAKGSAVPYARISRITPFHLGKQPIVLKNLAIGSTADWVQSNPGQYGLKIGEAQNDWIADHKYYHRAVCKYTTTDQTPSWMAYYARGGVLSLGEVNSPSAGQEYTRSGIVQSGMHLSSRNQSVYCGANGAISGVVTYGKQCLVIDLTAHPDLLAALATVGITSDAQIKAWLNEHIPWFPDEFSIGGSVTNLMSPISGMTDNGCTVAPIPNGVRVTPTSGHLWRLKAPSTPAFPKSRFFHKIHSRYISGAHESTVNIIDGGRYYYGHNRRGLPLSINLAAYPGEHVASSYGVVQPGSSAVYLYDFWAPVAFSSSDLIFDIWDSVAVDTYLSGLRAFMSLLGVQITDNGSHESEWLHEYLSYFEGEGNLSSILPSSLLVTSTSTNGLTKRATISYVKDGEDGAPARSVSAVCDSPVWHYTNRGARLNGSIALKLNMSNMAPISYQWHRNGIAISGAAGGTYSVPAGETGSYHCAVTDSAGIVESNAIEVTSLTDTILQPEYLGMRDSLPTATPQGQNLIDGDFFLAGETFTADGVTYTLGINYQKSGSAWVEDTSSAHIMAAMADFSEIASQADNMTANLMIMRRLIAVEAVVQELAAKDINLHPIGQIRQNYDADGNIEDAGKPGFYLGRGQLKTIMASLESAILKSVRIIGESSFESEISSAVLSTSLKDKDGDPITSIPFPAASACSYKNNALREFIRTRLTPNVYASGSFGTYDGKTVVGMIRSDSSNPTIFQSGAVAYNSGSFPKTLTFTTPAWPTYIQLNASGIPWSYEETSGHWTHDASSGSGNAVPSSGSPPSNPSDGDTYTTISNVEETGGSPRYTWTATTHTYHDTTTYHTGTYAVDIKLNGASVQSGSWIYAAPSSTVTITYQKGSHADSDGSYSLKYDNYRHYGSNVCLIFSGWSKENLPTAGMSEKPVSLTISGAAVRGGSGQSSWSNLTPYSQFKGLRQNGAAVSGAFSIMTNNGISFTDDSGTTTTITGTGGTAFVNGTMLSFSGVAASGGGNEWSTSGKWFSAWSVSFVPVETAMGVHVSDLLPKTANSCIGTQAEPFKTIYGTVNHQGTTNIVWGAVVNQG